MEIVEYVSPGDVDASSRDQLLDCWTAVTNAGGAVGFPFPPVHRDHVTPVLDRLVSDLDPQSCQLFAATDGEAATLIGWVVLRRSLEPLVRHWGVIERLQTHPRHRGLGAGRALLEHAERYAVDVLDLVQLHLAARGGVGLEDYYGRLGWAEVGRWPRALRLSDGDERDEVLMLRELAARTDL